MLLTLASLASSLWLSAASLSATDYLRKYDAIMGPDSFESISVMVAHRDDDSTRTYQFKILKRGLDKFRIWFNAPASAQGQELLRVNDNLWIYMPNIKKALRLASRDSFQGGDFNNADILRTNLAEDYSVTFKEGAAAGQVLLELVAKQPETSYDRILLWLDASSALPLKGQYFAASGKMLRSAIFSDVKAFGSVKRPARITMKNELVPKRYSELLTVRFNMQVAPADTEFILDNLGR